jgi:ArsR family metal-binding transcriptional regulator
MSSGDTVEVPCPHCGEQTAAPLAVILGGGEATCGQCHRPFAVQSSVGAETQQKLKRAGKKLTRTAKQPTRPTTRRR